MPISYVVDRVCGQIRTTVTGPITVKDILDHFESTHREQLLPFSELIDARQATTPYLSPDDLWSAAGAVRAVKVTQPFGPRAVVVDNLTKFGLVRIFATILSGHLPMSVFHDEEAAIEWLSSQPQPHRAIQPPPNTKSP